MRNGFRLFLMGALGVVVCACTARAEDKKVQFETIDGVQLEGIFYPAAPVAPAKNREATVMLLPNIEKGKGGGIAQPGWSALAEALAADGYSVLAFDFRGFGNSKTVSKDFWDKIKNPHNYAYVRGAMKPSPPETIDHKDFDNNSGDYYPYLVNDVAAAKAYLDRQNDKGQANTSSLILVGAGEGATLGAMWMASEWHRKKVSGRDPMTGMYTFDEPEGRDQAGAVWLGISTKLGGNSVPSTVHAWMVEMAGENKVPMAFVYGKDDGASDTFAKRNLESIEGRVRKENPGWTPAQIKDRLEFTNVKPISDTKLTGSELLSVGDTQDWIVKKYLAKVMEARGNKEPRKRDIKDDTFLWTFPGSPLQEAKIKGEDNLHLVPVKPVLRINSGN